MSGFSKTELKKNAVILFLLLFFPFQNAFAQDVASTVATVSSPGLAQKRLSMPENIPPPTGAAVSLQKPGIQPSQFAEAADLKFTLTKVTFEGNTVYSNEQLAAIFASSIDKEITLGDLEKMVQSITTKYRNAGYVLTQAILPPQSIQNGEVHVQIVEGYISHIQVTGDPGRARALIEAYGEKITQTRPLRMKVLERYLLLANDIPGVTVKAVITPSETVLASADLTLVAEHKIGQAYVSRDDYGTRYLGPLQTTVGAGVNSVIMPGDNTAAQYVVTTQPNELNFYELTHSEYIGSDGTRLLLGASYTHTHPGFLLEPIDLFGISRSLLADLSYPIMRSRTQNFYIHTQANYQNINTTVLAEPFYQDRIRSLDLGVHYDGADPLAGVNGVALDAEQGFDIFGANEGGDRSRPQGRSNYTKFNLNLSRLQGLGSRFSIFLVGQGQYALTPLLASEQFTFGGPVFGRGYEPDEIIGDRGMEGTAELRMDTYPDLWILLKAVQYYAFYDVGVVWNINADVSGLPARASGASAGFGTRVEFNRFFTGNFYVGKPLTRPVLNLVANEENGKRARIFFQIIASI